MLSELKVHSRGLSFAVLDADNFAPSTLHTSVILVDIFGMANLLKRLFGNC